MSRKAIDAAMSIVRRRAMGGAIGYAKGGAAIYQGRARRDAGGVSPAPGMPALPALPTLPGMGPNDPITWGQAQTAAEEAKKKAAALGTAELATPPPGGGQGLGGEGFGGGGMDGGYGSGNAAAAGADGDGGGDGGGEANGGAIRAYLERMYGGRAGYAEGGEPLVPGGLPPLPEPLPGISIDPGVPDALQPQSLAEEGQLHHDARNMLMMLNASGAAPAYRALQASMEGRPIDALGQAALSVLPYRPLAGIGMLGGAYTGAALQDFSEAFPGGVPSVEAQGPPKGRTAKPPAVVMPGLEPSQQARFDLLERKIRDRDYSGSTERLQITQEMAELRAISKKFVDDRNTARVAAGAKAEGDEQATLDRTTRAAEAARQKELDRNRRFSDTHLGGIAEATGGAFPFVAGAPLGLLARAATPGRTGMHNYGWPMIMGGASGMTAANLPLYYDSTYTESYNPFRAGAEAYARQFAPGSPTQIQWDNYAKGLEQTNPIRQNAHDRMYSWEAVPRTGYGIVEGTLGGLAGGELWRTGSRLWGKLRGSPEGGPPLPTAPSGIVLEGETIPTLGGPQRRALPPPDGGAPPNPQPGTPAAPAPRLADRVREAQTPLPVNAPDPLRPGYRLETYGERDVVRGPGGLWASLRAARAARKARKKGEDNPTTEEGHKQGGAVNNSALDVARRAMGGTRVASLESGFERPSRYAPLNDRVDRVLQQREYEELLRQQQRELMQGLGAPSAPGITVQPPAPAPGSRAKGGRAGYEGGGVGRASGEGAEPPGFYGSRGRSMPNPISWAFGAQGPDWARMRFPEPGSDVHGLASSIVFTPGIPGSRAGAVRMQGANRRMSPQLPGEMSPFRGGRTSEGEPAYTSAAGLVDRHPSIRNASNPYPLPGNVMPRMPGNYNAPGLLDPPPSFRVIPGGLERAYGGPVGYTGGGSPSGLVAGAVRGNTPGRADALNVDVENGCYVIPSDIVSALGGGNSDAGHAKIAAEFGPAEQSTAANGGVVPIKISDGEHVLSRAQVTKLGRGDHTQGCRIMDAMVKKVRAENVNKLRSLPAPAKG